MDNESIEANLLKQNILYLIEKAHEEGIKRGFGLGYKLGQLEKTNYSMTHSMPEVLMQAEEVRIKKQWEDLGL